MQRTNARKTKKEGQDGTIREGNGRVGAEGSQAARTPHYSSVNMDVRGNKLISNLQAVARLQRPFDGRFTQHACLKPPQADGRRGNSYMQYSTMLLIYCCRVCRRVACNTHCLPAGIISHAVFLFSLLTAAERRRAGQRRQDGAAQVGHSEREELRRRLDLRRDAHEARKIDSPKFTLENHGSIATQKKKKTLIKNKTKKVWQSRQGRERPIARKRRASNKIGSGTINQTKKKRYTRSKYTAVSGHDDLHSNFFKQAGCCPRFEPLDCCFDCCFHCCWSTGIYTKTKQNIKKDRTGVQSTCVS